SRAGRPSTWRRTSVVQAHERRSSRHERIRTRIDDPRCRCALRASRLRALGALLAALMLVPSQRLAAQETARFVGVVTDRETGAPLEGVRVAIRNTAIGTVTDGNGVFRISGAPAGEVTVVAELIGRRSL